MLRGITAELNFINDSSVSETVTTRDFLSNRSVVPIGGSERRGRGGSSLRDAKGSDFLPPTFLRHSDEGSS